MTHRATEDLRELLWLSEAECRALIDPAWIVNGPLNAEILAVLRQHYKDIPEIVSKSLLAVEVAERGIGAMPLSALASYPSPVWLPCEGDISMPHDMNGALLAEGDRVTIPCTVKTVCTGEDYCNVTVETDLPCLPGSSKNSYSLNAGQVLKAAVCKECPPHLQEGVKALGLPWLALLKLAEQAALAALTALIQSMGGKTNPVAPPVPPAAGV